MAFIESFDMKITFTYVHNLDFQLIIIKYRKRPSPPPPLSFQRAMGGGGSHQNFDPPGAFPGAECLEWDLFPGAFTYFTRLINLSLCCCTSFVHNPFSL